MAIIRKFEVFQSILLRQFPKSLKNWDSFKLSLRTQNFPITIVRIVSVMVITTVMGIGGACFEIETLSFGNL